MIDLLPHVMIITPDGNEIACRADNARRNSGMIFLDYRGIKKRNGFDVMDLFRGNIIPSCHANIGNVEQKT
jgi:hypothetical protein